MSVELVDPGTGSVIPTNLIDSLQTVSWRTRRLDRSHAAHVALYLVRATKASTNPSRETLIECVQDLSYGGEELTEAHARRLVDAAEPCLRN